MKKAFIIIISAAIICLTGLGVIGYFVEQNEKKEANEIKNEQSVNGENQWGVLEGDTLDINKIPGFKPGGIVVEKVKGEENSDNNTNTTNNKTNNNSIKNNNTNNSNNNQNSGTTNTPTTPDTTPSNPGDSTGEGSTGGNEAPDVPDSTSDSGATPEASSINAVPASFTRTMDNMESASINQVVARTQVASKTTDDNDTEDNDTDNKSKDSNEQAKENTSDNKETDENNTNDSEEEKVKVTEVGGLELPWIPPYKEMEVVAIGGYTGKFVEDGSDTNKNNILSMVIKNTSDKIIDYGEILIKISGENEALSFKVSNLKPGAAALVLVSNGETKFDENDKYTYLDSRNEFVEEMSLMSDDVKITTKDKEITVENISDKDLGTVYVYYKTVSPGGCYLGGITYRSKLVKVNKGKTVTADTLHFSKKNSEIIMVESVKE